MNGTRAVHRFRADLALLIVLAGWALWPAAVMIAHSITTGDTLTGADGLIGADQLQYLSWARDAGSHGLASNLFEISANPHVFVQPMFSLSGFLWWAGLPLQAAYLLWKPVAVVALFAGARAWTARLLGGRTFAGYAGLALALFFFTPVAAIAGWGTLGSPVSRGRLLETASELFGAGQLWGYLSTAIALGLMPLAVLVTERALRRPGSRRLILSAAAGALVSWLHPWEGVTLLLILLGLVAWSGRREWPILAAPLAGTALPLGYYLLLSRYDSAWKLAAHNELVPHLPLWALVLGLAPLLLVGCAGIRAPGRDLAERALLLWIPAVLVTYALLQTFPAHALASITLPASVLAVRGWQRLRFSAAIGWLTIAAVTLPGMAFEARSFVNGATGPVQEYYLTPSEARALKWVSSRAPRGGVLAPPLFAIAVPPQTGRPVWVGHQYWSRDYIVRARAASALFGGRLSGARARALAAGSGARLLVSDCRHRTPLDSELKPMLAGVHRFGCASVYVLGYR